MLRLLLLFTLLLLVCFSLACGYVAVSGAILTGPQSVSGLVSVVQFSFVNGSSSVTAVTLIGGGFAQTMNFCGDQRAHFPLNQNVSANFTGGATCDSLISVTVH